MFYNELNVSTDRCQEKVVGLVESTIEHFTYNNFNTRITKEVTVITLKYVCKN